MTCSPATSTNSTLSPPKGLLGQHVQGITTDGEILEGTVDAVHLDGSIVLLNVDGELLPMSGILSIGESIEVEDAS